MWPLSCERCAIVTAWSANSRSCLLRDNDMGNVGSGDEADLLDWGDPILLYQASPQNALALVFDLGAAFEKGDVRPQPIRAYLGSGFTV